MVLATGGRRRVKAAGLVSAVVVLGASFGLPAAVGAATRSHHASVIYTHRTIGTPFEKAGTNNSNANSGKGGAAAPAITTQPTSQSVPVGSTVTFTAAASGTPTPTVQWYVSVSGGSFTAISRATSNTYSFVTTQSQSGNAYKATFTNSAGSATTNPATLTVTAAPPPAPSKSTNWSGYADTGATFTSVSGNWTVPTVVCSGTATAYSSQWIGIDGDTSSTVEQDGTEADCLNGVPSYDAWYEMYGDSAVNHGYEVELAPSTYHVLPGDAMHATVSVSSTVWTLSIADSTRGWTFSTQVTFSAARSSAEWVVERPEICSPCTLASLANFGSVTITNASVSATTGASGGINSRTNTEIEMVSSKSTTVLALPSALSSGGAGFSDTWEASS